MSYEELALSGLKVLIAKIAETLSECRVCGDRIGVGCCTGIIERSKDARGTFLFDQVADNLVIKVLNWGPFDPLSRIFLLFRFKCELNEDLLRIRLSRDEDNTCSFSLT